MTKVPNIRDCGGLGRGGRCWCVPYVAKPLCLYRAILRQEAVQSLCRRLSRTLLTRGKPILWSVPITRVPPSSF